MNKVVECQVNKIHVVCWVGSHEQVVLGWIHEAVNVVCDVFNKHAEPEDKWRPNSKKHGQQWMEVPQHCEAVGETDGNVNFKQAVR
jgi:hypothetical protein